MGRDTRGSEVVGVVEALVEVVVGVVNIAEAVPVVVVDTDAVVGVVDVVEAVVDEDTGAGLGLEA